MDLQRPELLVDLEVQLGQLDQCLQLILLFQSVQIDLLFQPFPLTQHRHANPANRQFQLILEVLEVLAGLSGLVVQLDPVDLVFQRVLVYLNLLGAPEVQAAHWIRLLPVVLAHPRFLKVLRGQDYPLDQGHLEAL